MGDGVTAVFLGCSCNTLLLMILRNQICYLVSILWHFQCRTFGRWVTSPKSPAVLSLRPSAAKDSYIVAHEGTGRHLVRGILPGAVANDNQRRLRAYNA